TGWPAQVKRPPVTSAEGSPLSLPARAPPTGLALVRAAEERQGRTREDLQVDLRRAVLDVPDVHFDPVLPRQGGPAVHLRPAGDPGLDLEPTTLPRRVALDLVAERRSRADHAHVAAHDVPELRQLVDRQPAEDPARARDPRVTPVDRVAGAELLGADQHRPDLQQLELLAVLPHPALPVDDRAPVLELDGKRGGTEQRARHRQAERREHDVGRAVHAGTSTRTTTLS